MTEAASGSAFSPGQVLAGRYRVLAFLAHGGTGEVYEAEDLELGARVALKTIRPAFTWNERVVELFKREILLARQVTHANVCRTFEFFRQAEASPGAGETLYLTMELLRGETLAARLKRAGRLTTEEALPLLEQMAAGLAAAHAANIVHRDFKTSNVMLVPGEDGRKERAVIADFGLARLHLPEAEGDDLSRPEPMVGTSAYMAPEQVVGGTLTPAADVYALGVVLYEMVTGTRPFVGANTMATATMRLHQEPASPRTQVADLDPRWEEVILRCLAREPGQRPAAGQVVAELQAPLPLSRPSARRGTRGLLVLAVPLLALAGWLAVRTPATAPAASTPARPSVAVVDLRNASGQPDLDWLSAALGEMLAAELAVGRQLRVLSRDEVARALLEQGLAAATRSPADVARLRSSLSVDHVVTGSFVAAGAGFPERLRLAVQLVQAATGETLVSAGESSEGGDPFASVARVAGRLRAGLGAPVAAAAEQAVARTSLPREPEAARLYAEGLERLRALDASAARDRLAAAAAAEPGHALTHHALAQALGILGQEARAREAGARALALASSLPHEQRLLVQAAHHARSGQRAEALEVYRSLFLVFPDSLEYGLQLLGAQVTAGQKPEALATVAALRKLPASEAEAARIDLAAARTLDVGPRRAALEQAARRAEAAGARLLAARGFYLYGQASAGAAEPAAALRAYERAQKLYGEARDRLGVVQTANNIGLLKDDQGDLAAARAAFGMMLQVSRDLGNPLFQSFALNNLAHVSLAEGDLAAARAQAEGALVPLQGLDLPSELARTKETLAVITHLQGDLALTARLRQEALEDARKGNGRWVAGVLRCGQGRLAFDRDELQQAAAAYEECRAALDVIGETDYASRARLDLAELALEEGRLKDAQRWAEEARQVFARRGDPAREALSTALVARAVAASDPGAAEAALVKGRRLLQATPSRIAHWDFEIAAAPVDLVLGHASEAVALLEQVKVETQRRGARRAGLAAGIALAQARGGGADAAKDLQGLEKESRDGGFLRLARKASAARGRVASGRD